MLKADFEVVIVLSFLIMDYFKVNSNYFKVNLMVAKVD